MDLVQVKLILFSGQIYNITIGDSLCSRIGIYQPSSTCHNCVRPIICYQPPSQKAGKYNITENLWPGQSYTNPLSYKSTLTD